MQALKIQAVSVGCHSKDPSASDNALFTGVRGIGILGS
jgi:hypothetical protein